jgi:signal transduction histidine kinase
MLALSDANSETIIERHEQTDAQDIVFQAIERSKIALCTRPENTDSAIVFEYRDGQTAASVDLRTNKLYAVRVLAHLLENALKFTQEGSITLRMETTDSKVRFIVEDTGIGIPSDLAEYIFEEFAQLDSFAEGIGIGLTVARSVAQRMGGNLWLDPSYSQGARFIFELLRE